MQSVPAPGAPRPVRPATEGLSSVSRAARLLKLFGEGTPTLGVSEIGRRLGIGKSSAHRLVATLVHENLLEQTEEGQYRLAVKMYDLGRSVPIHQTIHRVSQPVLEMVRRQTGDTVLIGVRSGREVYYIDHLEVPAQRVGNRNWLHCTAIGKVLLAGMPDNEIAEMLDGWRLPAPTTQTVTSHGRLLAEIEATRRRGFATSIDENELGVAAVAAPIKTATGTIAGLAVVGSKERITAGLKHYAAIVMKAAQHTSRQLGTPS